MSTPISLHPDWLFPAESSTRDIARKLYQPIKDFPIISPLGYAGL